MRDLEYKFRIFNNIPAYSGINEQKTMLRKSVLRYAKTIEVVLNKDRFWICLKREIYKEFLNNIEDTEE